MASLTITVPDNEVPRILAAFTKVNGFGGQASATAEDVRQEIVQFVKQRVFEYESRIAAANAVVSVTTVSAT